MNLDLPRFSIQSVQSARCSVTLNTEATIRFIDRQRRLISIFMGSPSRARRVPAPEPSRAELRVDGGARRLGRCQGERAINMFADQLLILIRGSRVRTDTDGTITSTFETRPSPPTQVLRHTPCSRGMLRTRAGGYKMFQTQSQSRRWYSELNVADSSRIRQNTTTAVLEEFPWLVDSFARAHI
jgi:hypothetical protein